MNSTEPYLIQRPGTVRVKQWAKRRWNDAPKPIKQLIQSYIDLGWDLENCQDWGRQGLEITLEKCDTLNTDNPRGWHHSKTLTIDNKGKLIRLKNGKSFLTP